MIFRRITVACDCCGSLYEFQGPQRSMGAINEALRKGGWVCEGLVHTCPTCASSLENLDEDVLSNPEGR